MKGSNVIIKPKVRGFICTTTPLWRSRARWVRGQAREGQVLATNRPAHRLAAVHSLKIPSASGGQAAILPRMADKLKSGQGAPRPLEYPH